MTAEGNADGKFKKRWRFALRTEVDSSITKTFLSSYPVKWLFLYIFTQGRVNKAIFGDKTLVFVDENVTLAFHLRKCLTPTHLKQKILIGNLTLALYSCIYFNWKKKQTAVCHLKSFLV